MESKIEAEEVKQGEWSQQEGNSRISRRMK